ncbi:MAG: bifunctional phosphopantothenoylcysteine decarboxylase/phosphopantothenate--cysteine ligase CoaBC [Actinobacteria bacterium]|nr:bifunctional phosphopantothenoylcysteine decarboxylase/phosphopantothenate--cysteine ligase CoaBC [Actinomycetota bacterium]
MSSAKREIILGVGGGIAAYKSCELLRRLQDLDFAITVVPTPSSLNFVGTATWEALSGRSVTTEVWENVEQVKHVSLADLAEAIIIAPVTADLLARLAQGRAEDLLTNVVSASKAPKFLVPAMHPNMWLNESTQENVKILRARGFEVMNPDSGRLTGEDSGVGRFPETSQIISTFLDHIGSHQDLKDKKLLISAGGTREAIDPVRFIGNRSSGKQGVAIAVEARNRGADVCLVLANSNISDVAGIETIRVETAQQMHLVLKEKMQNCDVLVMTAAVADAKPATSAPEKIKKKEFKSIELVANEDILADLSSSAKDSQVIVGFAAETSNIEESGHEKLKAKDLDLIYVNDVSDGAIFASDLSTGYLITSDGKSTHIEETSKAKVARIILDNVVSRLSYANG